MTLAESMKARQSTLYLTAIGILVSALGVTLLWWFTYTVAKSFHIDTDGISIATLLLIVGVICLIIGTKVISGCLRSWYYIIKFEWDYRRYRS